MKSRETSEIKKEKNKITTIYVTEDCLKEMERLAQKFGYYQTRGPGAGKLGSISQLVNAIGGGEITLQSTEDTSIFK